MIRQSKNVNHECVSSRQKIQNLTKTWILRNLEEILSSIPAGGVVEDLHCQIVICGRRSANCRASEMSKRQNRSPPRSCRGKNLMIPPHLSPDVPSSLKFYDLGLRKRYILFSSLNRKEEVSSSNKHDIQ